MSTEVEVDGKFSWDSLQAGYNRLTANIEQIATKTHSPWFGQDKQTAYFGYKCRRGSRINGDRFPKRAPKAQASWGSGGMLPRKIFWILTL